MLLKLAVVPVIPPLKLTKSEKVADVPLIPSINCAPDNDALLFNSV